MLFYRAALPLSSRTLTFVAGLIRRHRAALGSPWRKLNPARQALLVLAYLRKGDTFAELAAGFDVTVTVGCEDGVRPDPAALAVAADRLHGAGRRASSARIWPTRSSASSRSLRPTGTQP
jgi:Helix-turn-helix of DDE superfamily endonuclease